MRGFVRTAIAGMVFLMLITVLAACRGSEATVAPTRAPTGAPTALPPTNAPPTNLPSTNIPPTNILPTEVPPAITRPAVLSFYGNLLAGIPDTPDTRQSVMINDYAAVRDIFGVQLPGPEAGDPALTEYIIGLLGPANMSHLSQGPFIAGISGEAMGDSKLEYLAFDGRNVDQSVEAGIVPAILEVAHGRFDPVATAQALEACSECPPPDIVTYNGVSFYSWGEDGKGGLKERNTPPAFDHLGRGGRIAVSSEYVYRTVETPGMNALIDSRAGDGKSLADVEEFRLLAQAMSDLDTYFAFFSDQAHKIEATSQAALDSLIAELGGPTLLLPYLAYAVGTGHDDTGPYLAFALVHRGGMSAEENKLRLDRRFSDNLDSQALTEGITEGIDEYTAELQGRVLSAKIRGDGPASRWKGLTLTIMPLLTHE
jgi:hypothetical protein